MIYTYNSIIILTLGSIYKTLNIFEIHFYTIKD